LWSQNGGVAFNKQDPRQEDSPRTYQKLRQMCEKAEKFVDNIHVSEIKERRKKPSREGDQQSLAQLSDGFIGTTNTFALTSRLCRPASKRSEAINPEEVKQQ
jgi:hypothetical protein